MIESFMQPLPIIDTGQCYRIIYIIGTIVATLLRARDAVFLIRNIMNTVEYKEDGRVLELEKLNPNAKRSGSNSTNHD